jgi:hypothetical protein
MTEYVGVRAKSRPICFLDLETTSLRSNRRTWEVGIIRREPDGIETTYHTFVAAEDLKLLEADPASLQIGRYYERHPKPDGGVWEGVDVGVGPGVVVQEWRVVEEVVKITRGAVIVGAVPNFDTETLTRMFRRHGVLPAWHYHLIDVETLAVGYLAARGTFLTPPWDSDDLSACLGIRGSIPLVDRHTALGDAQWAMRIYDHITSGH